MGRALLRLYSRPAGTTPFHPNGTRAKQQEKFGAIAQLGERFNGIEEVVGSIPSGSTKFTIKNNRLEIADPGFGSIPVGGEAPGKHRKL